MTIRQSLMAACAVVFADTSIHSNTVRLNLQRLREIKRENKLARVVAGARGRQTNASFSEPSIAEPLHEVDTREYYNQDKKRTNDAGEDLVHSSFF